MAAVKDRLTKEITYWDHRANSSGPGTGRQDERKDQFGEGTPAGR